MYWNDSFILLADSATDTVVLHMYLLYFMFMNFIHRWVKSAACRCFGTSSPSWWSTPDWRGSSSPAPENRPPQPAEQGQKLWAPRKFLLTIHVSIVRVASVRALSEELGCARRYNSNILVEKQESTLEARILQYFANLAKCWQHLARLRLYRHWIFTLHFL